MATNPINLGNGADLLQLFAESQGTPAATATQATAKVLKLAIDSAKLNAEQLIDGNSETGAQLNVYG
jgi:hypothetical protein